MAASDIDRLERELERFSGIHARLEGRRGTLVEQQAEITRKVAIAKGRVGLRKPIEAFIEEIQAEAYRKATHSFSTLLTTLVQEVLPNARPIALDLTTERGLPALHISVQRDDGEREDIFEDHGGALNNVMSMGLRLIAVVKAGGSRFLALDEPECWVKPDRIPAFFKVLEDAARRLKVQTVTITHHDAAANFSADVRIGTLVGTPEQGARIESDRAAHQWADDEAGFRSIRLVDFQAFSDTTMLLGPGVNALVGPNDHGKSSVVRALRAVFYGETRDGLIRHGAKGTTVELVLAHGRMLRFSRDRKRNPKNLWSLVGPDGKVVVENGTTYETGGNKPPEWVDAMFGMNRIDGLDIHLAHQKYPVFLLDRPSTQRASVLAIGQESGYTNDMLAIHKEWTAQGNATIKDGEQRIGELVTELRRLEALDGVTEAIAYAKEAIQASREWGAYVESTERLVLRMTEARKRLATARARGDVHAALDEVGDPNALRTAIDANRARNAVLDRLDASRKALQAAERRVALLADLPEEAPSGRTAAIEAIAGRLAGSRTALAGALQRRKVLSRLPDAIGLEPVDATLLDRLRKTHANLGAAVSRKDGVDEEIEGVRAEIEQLLLASGGHCPTCGHLTSADSILSQHSHAA